MNLLIVLGFLILLNAIFAMSEIAVVSSRKARLQRMVDEKRPGAAVAMALHAQPSTFLSTIQVGITTVGVLAGAIGESAVVEPLALRLEELPLLAPYAHAVALTVMVASITYVSVVVGELVPKRLGLLKPEVTAALIARPMHWLSRAARPLVWLLSASSDLILRLLRLNAGNEPPVTDAEIEVLMGQGAEAGIFHASEREIVANVLRLDQQRVPVIMTPRKDLEYIDLEDDDAHLRQALAQAEHHRVVVCRGGLDQVMGVLIVSDLLKPALEGRALNIEAAVRQPLYVPESVTTTQLLEQFRKVRSEYALIVDEYGALQGLVTVTDVLKSIVGEVPDEGEPEVLDIITREDGSWLVDGSASVERFCDVTSRGELPGQAEGDFHTMAGFVLHVLGRIPAVAETFEAAGLRFEVIDMDGNRVDKLLITPLPTHAVQASSD
ncbi:MAG TPA: hemolysin family protein [Burkholderiaceae bacterium]|nr:hemolysin family protein [Burkholderiaceae bacterium]